MRKRKLESLICNKPILKPIFGTTDHGWDIVNWKWLVNINSIAFGLKRSRKTIKRELLNGRYETLTNSISKIALTFSYSADISRFNRIKKYESKNKQKLSKVPKNLLFWLIFVLTTNTMY
jgi:IS30 family transposase